jgi:histidinol-phosphatase (PHP family)
MGTRDDSPAGPALYESHMHTPLCRHAVGEVEEYAAVAGQRGLSGIIVTCHNPLPDGYAQEARMYLEQFPEYLACVERARSAWAGRVDVRLGLECDYVPGFEAFLERQAASAPFDYLLGSVHPHVREYRAAHDRGDPAEFHRAYFDHLAMAAETGLFDCLSHGDIVKNVHPEGWDPQRIWPEICRALDRIARAGVAMELNTSGLTKDIQEMNPGPMILREMQRREIPVVVGSDAHDPRHVARWWQEAYDLLEEAGYGQVSLFLGRRQRRIDIARARMILRPL